MFPNQEEQFTTKGDDMTIFTNTVTNCKCDVCGGNAKYAYWEKLEGGAYNSYYRVSCETCEHVDTNDIFYEDEYVPDYSGHVAQNDPESVKLELISETIADHELPF